MVKVKGVKETEEWEQPGDFIEHVSWLCVPKFCQVLGWREAFRQLRNVPRLGVKKNDCPSSVTGFFGFDFHSGMTLDEVGTGPFWRKVLEHSL